MIKTSVVAAINPAARNVDESKVTIIREYLEKRCHVEGIVLSKKAGDIEALARKLSRDRAVELIVVVGGDGTLNEAVNGLEPGGPRIGYVPAGTTNVIRFELGIPGDLVPALENAVYGRPLKVKPGICNGRKFMLMVGAGMDAEIVRDVHKKLKKALGKGEYIRVGLKKFFRTRFSPIEVAQGGEFLGRYSWVVTARAPHYAGFIRLVQEASLKSDSLYTYMFKGSGFFHYILYTIKAVSGRPFTELYVDRASGPSFTLNSKGKVPYQLDGDFLGYLPATVSVSDHWVEINVPASRINKILES